MPNLYITRLYWTKLEYRCWSQTDSFVRSPRSTKPDASFGIKGTAHPYVHAPNKQNLNNPSLSRFEVFANAQTFCYKHDPLYITQYSDLFVTYRFNMHTGQPNRQSMINEYLLNLYWSFLITNSYFLL